MEIIENVNEDCNKAGSSHPIDRVHDKNDEIEI